MDLYGGTRHSTTSALTPEQIKNHGTMHSTNKAFERYFQRKAEDSRKVYQTAADLQHVYNKSAEEKSYNLLKFRD